MPARHVVLVVMAGVVLMAGLYLFHAVHQVPDASAAVPVRHDSPPPVDETASAARPTTMRVHAAAPTTAAAPEIAGDPQPGDDLDSMGLGSAANPKLDAIMDQANKAYDHQDYEEAKSIAGKVLAKLPTNSRMLRIMVSSACLEGDQALAQQFYVQLPKPDRLQMKQRCDRAGITFTEPAQ
ncbi:MAG TPA: hypothetical protein VH143_10225 [Kofleriaceae bacterium]|nr:hypothetical protein [Kofleriaceae bacterium]